MTDAPQDALTRYGLIIDPEEGNHIGPDPEGNFVLYSDVAAILSARPPQDALAALIEIVRGYEAGWIEPYMIDRARDAILSARESPPARDQAPLHAAQQPDEPDVWLPDVTLPVTRVDQPASEPNARPTCDCEGRFYPNTEHAPDCATYPKSDADRWARCDELIALAEAGKITISSAVAIAWHDALEVGRLRAAPAAPVEPAGELGARLLQHAAQQPTPSEGLPYDFDPTLPVARGAPAPFPADQPAGELGARLLQHAAQQGAGGAQAEARYSTFQRDQPAGEPDALIELERLYTNARMPTIGVPDGVVLAAIKRLRAAPAAPPREPTKAMEAAGEKKRREIMGKGESINVIWRAMYDAAQGE